MVGGGGIGGAAGAGSVVAWRWLAVAVACYLFIHWLFSFHGKYDRVGHTVVSHIYNLASCAKL